MAFKVIYAAFAKSILSAIGNNNPKPNLVKFLVGWMTAESGNEDQFVQRGAQFNPLNTTLSLPGSSNFNAIGVKNYQSQTDGIWATRTTLMNGHYSSLVKALQANDENSLGFNRHAMTAAIAGDLTVWVSGKRSPVDKTYIHNIMQVAGVATTDVQDQPGAGVNAAPDPLAALNSIGTFFTSLDNFFNQGGWIRLAKIGAGAGIVLFGLILLIQNLVPGEVKQVASTIKKAL